VSEVGIPDISHISIGRSHIEKFPGIYGAKEWVRPASLPNFPMVAIAAPLAAVRLMLSTKT
jgi:hypothetical protein